MTKVALGLRTWVATCINEPKDAYANTFLCMQLGFQKHKKCKFSTIMADVWNEFHIIWELFQTPFFQLKKTLHCTFSKHTEIPQEKPKIH